MNSIIDWRWAQLTDKPRANHGVPENAGAGSVQETDNRGSVDVHTTGTPLVGAGLEGGYRCEVPARGDTRQYRIPHMRVKRAIPLVGVLYTRSVGQWRGICCVVAAHVGLPSATCYPADDRDNQG